MPINADTWRKKEADESKNTEKDRDHPFCMVRTTEKTLRVMDKISHKKTV